MQPETSWTLVRDAADGDPLARTRITELFLPAVRSFLEARWRGTRWSGDVEDVVQEVFLDLLRADGALGRADPERGRFRAFVYGVARTAARSHESRRATGELVPSGLPAPDPTASRVFDRTWAKMIMKQAVRHMRERAGAQPEGELHEQVELLQLRFEEGLPIREIAARWQRDAEGVHRLYRRARQGFLASLEVVVMQHSSCPREQVRDECRQLAELLAE